MATYSYKEHAFSEFIELQIIIQFLFSIIIALRIAGTIQACSEGICIKERLWSDRTYVQSDWAFSDTLWNAESQGGIGYPRGAL